MTNQRSGERERELYEVLSTNKKLEQKNPKKTSVKSTNKLCNDFSRVEKWVGKMLSEPSWESNTVENSRSSRSQSQIRILAIHDASGPIETSYRRMFYKPIKSHYVENHEAYWSNQKLELLCCLQDTRWTNQKLELLCCLEDTLWTNQKLELLCCLEDTLLTNQKLELLCCLEDTLWTNQKLELLCCLEDTRRTNTLKFCRTAC